MTGARPAEPINVHASCVLVGSAGVLLRGASSAGKSRLGDLLVALAGAQGRFAAPVADDRVVLCPLAGRLVAAAPPPLLGLWERRGVGIERVTAEPRVVLRLVVDLLPPAEIERMPNPQARSCVLAGVTLPRLTVATGDLAGAALQILAGLPTPSP